MKEWIIVLLSDLILPVVVVIAGLILQHRPPKSVNALFGYRTERSMRSKEAWDFSQVYSGKRMTVLGIIAFPVTLLLHLPFYGAGEGILGVVCIICVILQCACLAIPIVQTERALKAGFNPDGTPKA